MHGNYRARAERNVNKDWWQDLIPAVVQFEKVHFEVCRLLNVYGYLTPTCLWSCSAPRHQVRGFLVFQDASQSWVSLGSALLGWGKLRHTAMAQLPGILCTVSSSTSLPRLSLCFGLRGRPKFSLCQLAFFEDIFFLRCFNFFFFPGTSHLLIYLPYKKLCTIKSLLWLHSPLSLPLFFFLSFNFWWPFFDFGYLLRSGRIRPLSWSELWNT